MRIAIFGSGGVGGYFGALLARAGHDVSFIARGEHLESIRQQGLRVKTHHFGELCIRTNATSNPTEVERHPTVPLPPLPESHNRHG